MKSEKSLILIEIGYEKVTTDNKFFDVTKFCFDGENRDYYGGSL